MKKIINTSLKFTYIIILGMGQLFFPLIYLVLFSEYMGNGKNWFYITIPVAIFIEIFLTTSLISMIIDRR